ncbi:polysaccharide biosynthesis protein [Algoriphagus winogradskyi]|uniref:NDP-sugar epimerase, includes UDP-GlcNAc-inverting 4,6-dehydratase FlaA1 and capsular polysaccharide biosynthesis protein EpsC n=1 Tax=Algoriphagus winogradskyi TaxID=237017 RepID=A0ABY1P1L0_9BACT|nr:nucleoside-diphosphate sugar epimerase/dehydratase [Algoriphagus winogradskyi]SMP24321.1 NDP-sugar epimerase, includes UDP-GlcNAc-inverting 4,6-dehydratase FlaA1 and capsular polysaccharide biosynthesis protein EpsC [Algoriphagus winogradskyi]
MSLIARLTILPRWVIAVIDALILFSSAFCAFLVRFNFNWQEIVENQFLTGCAVFMIVSVLVLRLTNSQEGIVRHTGFKDGVNLFKSLFINFSILFIPIIFSDSFISQGYLLPSSVLIIASVFSLVLLIFYRLMVKELFVYFKNEGSLKPSKNGVIFGAGEAGIIAKEAIMRDSKSLFNTIAFLDDDPKKEGKHILGKRIYKGLDNLEDLAIQFGITELIIAIRDLSVARKNEIIDECLRLKISVSIVPPVDQWINGGLTAGAIREVKIEDLLSREQIVLDNPKIQQDLQGKVIMVTGAAGSIGSELCRQICHYEPKLLILFDIAESALYDVEQEFKENYSYCPIKIVLGDIRNKKKLNEIFQLFKPQVVFHAAAYKHVPMMENYPDEAINSNILGTKILADISVLAKVDKFVFVSTDKAVNPTNVMGASKRAAEMYVQALNEFLVRNHKKSHTKFITTRFGNVLGSSGSVIPLFKKQIMNGGPITVTHPDITRYFMTIPEACQLVLEAGIMGEGGEIYVFDMGEPIKILDLAKKMIQLSGKKIDEDIKVFFSGLREGEKLYEELLNDFETVKITHHPKIKIAQVLPSSYHKIDGQIELFMELVSKKSENELVSHLKVIVPEFISNSSRFEVLDRLN